jgi:ADP-ribose pyrophosphatase
MNYPYFPRPELQPLPADAKKVFTGEIFDVYQWQQEMYDGSFATFERLKRKDTVLVIPITTEGKILITHQQQPHKDDFISFAGGVIEEGEEVGPAAARELLEETGYQLESLELWESFQIFSKIDWAVYTLIAKGCHKVKHQVLDAGERISVEEIDFDQLTKLVAQPNFREANITRTFLEAKIDSEKMNELRDRFLP